MPKRIHVSDNRPSWNYAVGLSLLTHPVTDRLGSRLAFTLCVDLWVMSVTVRLRECARRA